MMTVEYRSARFQRGASPMLTLLFVAMLAFFVTIGFKLAPGYYDFWQIRKVAESFRDEPDLAKVDAREVESRIDKRLMTNNIRSFDRKKHISVVIQDDVLYIDVEYEQRVKMFGNVDAIMTFQHSFETALR
jgi:hypothetical protein